MFVSEIDRFSEKLDLANISEYYYCLDDLYFLYVTVQDDYENVRRIDLEEIMKEVDKYFND